MVIAPFLIWLLCIGIAALMIGNFLQDVELKEGFVANPVAVTTGLSMTACPNGTTTYVNKSGYTNCCDSDIVNDTCNGRDMCSLSPSIAGGPPSCADFFTKEWIARGRRFCPQKSMPNYFGTLSRRAGTEGCSASPAESDGSRPSDDTLPKCRIYGNMNDEMGKSDSCFNAISLDAVVCPQTDAKKSMISYGSSLPMIFRCNYIPRNGSSNGMPVDCMDANRAVEYVNRMDRTDKAQAIANINSGSDVQFCNGSKAYYVDRTLTSGAKSVPGQSCPTATATASAATASAATAPAATAAATAERTRLQKAKDAASKAAELAKQKASQAGAAAMNRAAAAASKIGNFFRR
jgi:hypothetical protein